MYVFSQLFRILIKLCGEKFHDMVRRKWMIIFFRTQNINMKNDVTRLSIEDERIFIVKVKNRQVKLNNYSN